MGRVVFITGGGTGLGLACAREFCSQGDHVCITGRRENVLEKACAQVRKDVPDAKIFFAQMDVRDPVAVGKAVDHVVATTGQLPSVVLNNAAGNFISPTEKLSPNAWKSILDIVLFGGINTITTVAKRWIAQREEGYAAKTAPDPQVVFLSVGASYVENGAPFLAPSAAAKSGILSLTKSLANEWGKYNMRFVMVSPGPIYTEGAMSRLDPLGASNLSKPNDRASVGETVPLGFMASPREYAKFMGFVASPACRWLTGCNIHYDGGSEVGGGEFQQLKQMSKDEWAMMEKAIRKTSSRQKKGVVAKSNI